MMICPVRRREMLCVLAAFLLLGATFAARPVEGQLKCFPSCSPTDGRFLVIASGTGLVTLSEEQLDMEFAVPAGTTSFQLGIFDGDSGGVDNLNVRHWDSGVNIPYSYTLYAEPLGDGNGSTIVDLVPGSPSISSLTMPNNNWIDFTVNTSAAAQSPSGNYIYRLHIQLLNNSVSSYNSFKIRTTGITSIRLADQPFSYMATLIGANEARIIYPSFPTLTPTTYDGTFRFFFDFLDPQTDVSVWDGDFDRGKADGTDLDTDDPDTPSSLPPWATPDTVAEGVASGFPAGTTGNPADDSNNSVFLRTPSVRSELRFPDAQVFTNGNPSGNQEWEQFRVSTDPFDASQMDASTTSVPSGVYELRVLGVDLGNLNALRLPDRALCVSTNFEPCTPLYPFLVGDTVFLDLDGNGMQAGSGEAGIAGVTVELLGALGTVIRTATTDANGMYSFGVPAGTFTVRIASSNFATGGALAGTISTTGNQRTESVINDNVLTYDFGYRGNGSIGDRVWLDLDDDGVQDSGEAGINGVTVELLDGGGNVVAATATAGDGGYSFSHLFPGTYSVRVVTATLPAGLLTTYDLDGTGTAHVATLTLGAGQNREDVDFGYRGTASIGDRVWFDIDGDGSQDASEDGLNGVTVRLRDGNGNVIATTVTAGDGGYLFDNLPAGTYTVEVVASTLPGDAAPTYDLDGIATLDAATVTVATGEDRTDVDFGYRGTSALGDRVWYDIDGDGSQDVDEVGLPGVTVELLDGGGTVIAATVTAGNGIYGFAGLFAGTYTVRVDASTLPGGAVATYDLDGTGTTHTATASVANGQNLSTVDFGYRGTASLGDRVWLDLDGDGAQDAGEPGLNGVAVELLDGTGAVLASTATAAGIYGFNNLLAGSYTIRVVTSTLPPGLVQTYDLDGTATAHTAALALSSGETRTDVDFGYRGTLQFGDRVWFDYDGNGIQDTGEPGLSGVTIELRDGSGTLIATTITGANGLYSFSNLPAGTYTVTVVASSLPGGAVPTYDLDGTATPGTAAVVLTSGQNRTDVDFGYRGTASLGDRVWLDFDADGVQDAGETGINGVTVQLLDTAGNVIASAVTAGNGNYTFPNLLAGTYKVQVVAATLPAGMIQTYDLDGTGTAHVATAAVAGGQSRTDVDFGYRANPAPGTGTIGYWKTHPEAWPVATITIGGVVYTRDQAIVLMGTPSRGDKSIDLFKQLVAAKLNVIAGNNPSCIYQTAASADAWMAAYPPGSNVGGGSSAWTQASPWHTQLDNYNNGQLCAPHRN